MIGSEKTQYIKSEKLKGFVVTRQDYIRFRNYNQNPDIIKDEAKRIMMTNAELGIFNHECAVILYKKMKHLDSIKTHISHINLVTSIDIGGKFFPRPILRFCDMIQDHRDDISFYIMKIYEPDYRISDDFTEEQQTLANCGERDINVASMLRSMEIPEDIARGADKIYRDGLDFTNILVFCVSSYVSYRKRQVPRNIRADIEEI